MIAPGFILGAKSPSQKGVQLQVASMSSNHFPKQFHQFALGAGKLPFFPGFVHLVTLPTQWLCHGKSLWSIMHLPEYDEARHIFIWPTATWVSSL